MKVVATAVNDLYAGDCRLDASYHASAGVKALRRLRRWAGATTPTPVQRSATRESSVSYGSRRLDRLDEVCKPDGIFIGGRAKRIYVTDPEHGVPFLSSSDMLLSSFDGVKLISKKQPELESMLLRKGWTLISRSGTIGNVAYAREDMDGLAGSEHIMRVVPDPKKILPGYVYAYLSSALGNAIVKSSTFGSVVDTIAPDHIAALPIPRLDAAIEARIHALVERAAALRVEAKQRLEQAQQRFNREVLGLPAGWQWKHLNEHARAIGVAGFTAATNRLDAFHYVGYVGEAEAVISAWHPLGDLIEPYQPPLFKRPYTGKTGIPFLSGMDLYDAYPKPHMYISRKMKGLERYIVKAGTILVQNVGQRYGIFGRPMILPRHLDSVAVTQHLMRVYLKNPDDRGFVYVWLSTETGRRVLLKQSFGTSMGVLFEQSFRQMPVPQCSAEVRHSFEPEIQTVCDLRDEANTLEDQAQALLVEALEEA